LNLESLQTIKQRFGIIGNNNQLNEALQKAMRVAPTDISVLVTGESGVGKEVIPKIIHNLSHRKHAKYIAVNCGAIPEGTIDSELFGYEKGSFTGASQTRNGYFEVADGGTIFLDEVGELPLTTQVRLLRVLENGEFLKVGSSKVQKTDVRIVAATNLNMNEAIHKGKFREDLFYRLNVIPVSLPALRERMDDMRLLAEFFVEKYKTELAKPELTISPDALKLLMKLPWEGNIRELENTIERAAILCSGDTIESEDVQPDTLYSEGRPVWGQDVDLRQIIPEDAGLNEVLYSVEKKMLTQALSDTDFVQARAAENLGITKSLLQYKMKKYQIKKKK